MEQQPVEIPSTQPNRLTQPHSPRPHKPKKPFIIAGIIVLLLLIIGGGVYALTKKDDTASTNSSTSSSIDTSTNTVANSEIIPAATAFLATLDDTQKAKVQFELTKENATAWSNLPCGSTCRVGIQTSELNETQLAALKVVVKAAMGSVSGQGYEQAMQILAADDYLGTQGSSGGPGGGGGYSSGNYYLAFLGTPSATGTWQLHFGGHHLAVNNTYKDGKAVSATPEFIGVEPTSWVANGTTYAPLTTEHDKMTAMLASLSADQLAKAKLSSSFTDVLMGPDQDGTFPSTKLGLTVSELSDAQKTLVLEAMKPWVQDADATLAATLLKIYESELNETYISYSGNASLSNNADYVRIDGPSVWIEFVCQSGVVIRDKVHYHTVWRDHTRDYGAEFSF